MVGLSQLMSEPRAEAAHMLLYTLVSSVPDDNQNVCGSVFQTHLTLALLNTFAVGHYSPALFSSTHCKKCFAGGCVNGIWSTNNN
jgi:hypothetical protein